MDEKKRILIITQEMKPYLALSEIAEVARKLPQYIQEKGMEIRVLMPRFGNINERRHRLHEVVRLSGINIIINEDDYPLIIKVASLPGARLQVYFLDNEDLFKRKAVFHDAKDNFFQDNAERMIFFCKGVLETVKKFGWPPDIIHCMGWMTSLIPLYLKTAYKDEPVFANAKVIYSLYKNSFSETLSKEFLQKAPINESIGKEDLKPFDNCDNEALNKGAVAFSDAVIMGSEDIEKNVRDFLGKASKPILDYVNGEDFLEEYQHFYESLQQS